MKTTPATIVSFAVIHRFLLFVLLIPSVVCGLYD
jgi:hypothetical protein